MINRFEPNHCGELVLECEVIIQLVNCTLWDGKLLNNVVQNLNEVGRDKMGVVAGEEEEKDWDLAKD